jgi:hypothetical protein
MSRTSRAALRFGAAFGGVQAVSLNTEAGVDVLRRTLTDDVAVRHLPDRVDEQFFSPAPSVDRGDRRPMIFAAARTSRCDYDTIMTAVDGLDIDAKIFSPRATGMPDPLPTNVTVAHGDWTDVRDLYQAADLVVVSVTAGDRNPGLDEVLEAMACSRPVVATIDRSADSYMAELFDRGLLIGVPAGDAEAMRDAIVSVLADPRRFEPMGQRARQWVLARHSTEAFQQRLVPGLAGIA